MRPVLAGIVLIVILSVIYISHLPYTVQVGDTGELVKAAYLLLVPHPPGYPLFTWLNHLAINIVDFNTVFWRAALLTSIFSILTCITFLICFRKKPILGIAVALALGTSRLYWRYSELPDVFIFNALFATIISVIYIDPDFNRWKKYIPLIFMIALTNHLTMIFLLPMAAHIGLKNIKSSKQWVINIFALFIFFGFYGSMFFFHPSNLDSWGQLDQLKNIVNHFLRVDYGTFTLVSTGESSTLLQNLKLFCAQYYKSFSVLLVLGIAALIFRLKKFPSFNIEEIIFSSSILLYIFGFFTMSNMGSGAFRNETFERFFILADVLLALWSGYQIYKCGISKKLEYVITFFIFISAINNFIKFSKLNDFSENTIIEDLAINILNNAPTEKPGLLITMTDTRYNSLKYVQTVLNIRKDIVVVHPRMLFNAWYVPKLLATGVQVNQDNLKNKLMTLEEDLIIPNMEKFYVYSNLQIGAPTNYKITITSLGRAFSKGSGITINANEKEDFLLRSGNEVIFTPNDEYDPFREALTEYSYYPLAVGTLLYEQKDFLNAETYLKKALKIAPWLAPAKRTMCHIEAELHHDFKTCEEESKKIESEYYQYFII